MSHVTFPFTCSSPPPRLPRNPHDGDTVCDLFGNIFKYEATEDAWIFRGVLKVPEEVTEINDGIVPPEIFDQIQLFRSLTNNGRDFPPELKIEPHTEAYWYYFDSSDKLFRFLPEAENRLRIEVDRARLFTFLARQSKRGSKGLTGDKGETGQRANFNPLSLLSAHCEPPPCVDKCLNPKAVSPDGRTMDFEAVVETPFDTDISLRLLLNETSEPSITVLIPPTGDKSNIRVTVADPNLKVDIKKTKDSISYDRETKKLIGSFVLEDGIWSIFCILVRQKGSIGDPGDDYGCFKPQECVIEERSLRFTDPIISVRRGCNQDQFLVTTANLFSVVCVDKLRLDVASPGADMLASGSIINGRLLAVESSLDQCKDLVSHKPNLRTIDKPELELPEWRPQSDCQNSRYFDQSSLDWTSNTDGMPYPWQIMGPLTPQPGICDPCDNPPRLPQGPPCPPTTTGAPTTPAPTTTAVPTTPAPTTTTPPTTTTTTTSVPTTTTTSIPTTTTNFCPETFITGFEPPTYSGSAAGVVLTGQDGWFLSVANLRVYTYTGNALGAVLNPTGSDQFIGNVSGAAGTRRLVNFAVGGIWTFRYDFNFVSGSPVLSASIMFQQVGLFSTERMFEVSLRWETLTDVSVYFLVRNAVGASLPPQIPGPQWQSLSLNNWYRHVIEFDIDTNLIISVTIINLTTSSSATVFPVGWYLDGVIPTRPLPTEIRFVVSGGAGAPKGAYDNVSIECNVLPTTTTTLPATTTTVAPTTTTVAPTTTTTAPTTTTTTTTTPTTTTTAAPTTTTTATPTTTTTTTTTLPCVQFVNLPIDGLQEVPPNAVLGTGTFNGILDTITNTLTYTITYAGLTGLVVASHFHLGAVGVDGPVIEPIPSGPGPIVGVWNYPGAQEANLLNGLIYVNLHTAAFPGGEIRGQLVNGIICPETTTTSTTSTTSSPTTSTTSTSTTTTVSPPCYVVISELRSEVAGGTFQQFIELFNPTAAAIDISGWFVMASTSLAVTSPVATIPPNTILAPGQHFLIAEPIVPACHLVISEFRSAVPGGTFVEFVELFNPTAYPIDVSNWEVWVSDDLGNQSLLALIPFQTILVSGQHYLIEKETQSCHIVISEFRSAGGDFVEFVELFNPTAHAVDITGWEVWISDDLGNQSLLVVIPTVSLAPGQHYLIEKMV